MDDTQVKAPRPEGPRVVVPRPADGRVVVPRAADGRSAVPQEGSALRRLARDDSSRKRFLKMVGGAGAASAFSILLAACGGDDEGETVATSPTETEGTDTARAAGEDLDILNYALMLEYVEVAFYEAVLNSDITPPSQEVAEIVQTFGDQEQEHVDALIAIIEQMGGTPTDPPQANFEEVLQEGARDVLDTAARLENVGASAYLNEVPQIQSDEVLAAAVSIHSVEARHAAALNELAGFEFTGQDQFEGSIPDGAFGTPAERDAVMREIEPFLEAGG